MIVITKNSEIKLERELKYFLKNYPKQECIYIRLSDFKEIPPRFQENFLEILHEIPESYRAQIYFCEDKDIFIFMFEFMRRQFIKAIKKMVIRMEFEPVFENIAIYKVAKNYDEILLICRDKIEVIKDRKLKEEEEKRKQIADHHTQETLAIIDIESVQSITQKRLSRSRPVVHIIDDDQLSRTLVENVLRHSYDMQFSRNGQTGLKDYVECAPDVVFLDIGLPDIGGHEILEALSQLDPNHYVIMFSGRRDKANLLKALRLGAQGFIGKPFSRDKLAAYIERSPFIIEKSKHIKDNEVAK